jgi:hypothetical protein
MNSIDNKIIYNLFCNNILLQYLEICDKTELSLACKFIFKKCTIFRLSNFSIDSNEFGNSAKHTNVETKLLKDIFDDQIEHANAAIIKYKPHILSLEFINNDKYYILEHLSKNFSYLGSLRLVNMCIPQKNFKNIIENLPNLYNLLLSQIGIALRKHEQKLVKFEFPKRLKKLTMESCYQFNFGSEYSASIGFNQNLTSNSCRNSLDITKFSINSIKHLVWASNYKGNIEVLNALLVNNHKLEKLKLSLNPLNFNSLSLISNSRYLTKMTISAVRDIALNSNYIPKLPFIKYIECIIFAFGAESVNMLLQSCPNLEELRCFLTSGPENGNIIRQVIKTNKNLKRLSINDLALEFLLSIPFPESNIEHLEFVYSGHYTGNFNALCNLKKLKSIKITRGSKPSKDYDLKSQLFSNVSCWKEIEYSNSIQFWKIS